MLFKAFAVIDAFPICLDTTNADQIVATVRVDLAPGFHRAFGFHLTFQQSK
jgi:malate dehydrogenase (oxaloacetate-decarboxylating)